MSSYKVMVREPAEPVEKLVLLLPGRGQPGSDILARYNNFAPALENCRLVSIEPIEEWYPAPNGADDQLEACWGLKVSVPELCEFIEELQAEYGLEKKDIAIVGFSAGAVMAIQVAIGTQEPFGAIVSYSGAVLEPDEIPPAFNDTPFLLIHNEDDDCFSWEERYVPMKEALENQQYRVTNWTSSMGGHGMSSTTIDDSGKWIIEKLK